jgi:hypothetical protein
MWLRDDIYRALVKDLIVFRDRDLERCALDLLLERRELLRKLVNVLDSRIHSLKAESLLLVTALHQLLLFPLISNLAQGSKASSLGPFHVIGPTLVGAPVLRRGLAQVSVFSLLSCISQASKLWRIRSFKVKGS